MKTKPGCGMLMGTYNPPIGIPDHKWTHIFKAGVRAVGHMTMIHMNELRGKSTMGGSIPQFSVPTASGYLQLLMIKLRGFGILQVNNWRSCVDMKTRSLMRYLLLLMDNSFSPVQMIKLRGYGTLTANC